MTTLDCLSALCYEVDEPSSATPVSSDRPAGVLILYDAKNLLYWNDEQFWDAFDFDDREGIFLHASIREIDDLAGEEIIAMQVERDFRGVGVVDIADFEVDTLIDPGHASHLASVKTFIFEPVLDSLQGTCHGLRNARFSSEPLDRKGVEAVSAADCRHPRRTDRKGCSACVEAAFRKKFSA